MDAVFTHLVLTAPDETIASTYRRQIQQLRNNSLHLRGCRLHCVNDPSGVRIGSGGGTVNALDYLCNLGVDHTKERILIIHSGR